MGKTPNCGGKTKPNKEKTQLKPNKTTKPNQPTKTPTKTNQLNQNNNNHQPTKQNQPKLLLQRREDLNPLGEPSSAAQGKKTRVSWGCWCCHKGCALKTLFAFLKSKPPKMGFFLLIFLYSSLKKETGRCGGKEAGGGAGGRARGTDKHSLY